jgi:hypothetical protein
MCTVTFIPFQDQYFITSNRDESPGRQARGLITQVDPDGNAIYFPIDEASQGSWIALSHTGRTACLLNGAFHPFIPAPPYRISRGQIVMQAIRADDLQHFVQTFELEGIAPFTLLLFENGLFVEWIWDGRERFMRNLSPDQPEIWSSVTLYPPDVRQWRRALFENWMESNSDYTRESIMAFHQMKQGDDTYDFVMNRNEIVKTLSVTSILLQHEEGSILHLDLEKNIREEIQIRYAE